MIYRIFFTRTGLHFARKRSKRASSSWRPIPWLTLALVAGLVAVFFLPATEQAGTIPGDGQPERHVAQDATAQDVTAQDAATLADAADAPAGQAEAAPPVAAWVRVERPVPRFTLGTTLLAGGAQQYDAGIHTTGGGRDDVVTSGTFAASGPLLRLSVYRPGSEALPAPGFFVDLVRRAGEVGLAVRKAAVASPLATRFGAVEASEALFAGSGRERTCLAFRMLSADPALRLSGWLCGPDEAPPQRADLACLLDSLQWNIAATDESAVLAFFNAAPARPEAADCAPQPASAAPATPRPPARQGAKPHRR